MKKSKKLQFYETYFMIKDDAKQSIKCIIKQMICTLYINIKFTFKTPSHLPFNNYY